MPARDCISMDGDEPAAPAAAAAEVALLDGEPDMTLPPGAEGRRCAAAAMPPTPPGAGIIEPPVDLPLAADPRGAAMAIVALPLPLPLPPPLLRLRCCVVAALLGVVPVLELGAAAAAMVCNMFIVPSA